MRKTDTILYVLGFSELIQDTHLTTNSCLLEAAKDHSTPKCEDSDTWMKTRVWGTFYIHTLNYSSDF